ncbi:MAG: hypothetical protein E7J95_08530, partial [Staphylococcus sp.]|nr:hypothetical protein [Staphylococcus sp.]
VRIGTNDKPQISIKLDRLKVNNVETKNYSNLCSGDEIEFTYKISAEDLQIEDINEEVNLSLSVHFLQISIKLEKVVVKSLL